MKRKIRFKMVLGNSLKTSSIIGALIMIYCGATTPQWDDKPMYWAVTFFMFFIITLCIVLPVYFTKEYKQVIIDNRNQKHQYNLFLKRNNTN